MCRPPLYPPACQSTFLKGRHIRAKPPYIDVKRVLAILNSLYRNKAFALVRENLQNSIDAGARNIWITFTPEERKATFVDDGTGIPIGQMDERHSFGVTWSTNRGKDLIGSKGIGRLTNRAPESSPEIETGPLDFPRTRNDSSRARARESAS